MRKNLRTFTTVVAMSQKQQRILALLFDCASKVDNCHKHAAALVKGGRVIAFASNSSTCHAEEAVLRAVYRQQGKREEEACLAC